MTRLRRHRQFFGAMSSKVQCYLRPLRKQWSLTQGEMASLLPKGSRSRVSRVELGKSPPNAHEIVAYKLIFGSPARAIFPGLWESAEEEVMQRAYRFHKKMVRRKSRKAQRKVKLTERMLARATGGANQSSV
jgi:transcriptional regulator with XRE-family HTH domain